MAEIQTMSLHFVVLSFDRYSRDDVIGEVILPLNDVELGHIETQQVALCKEIQPRSLKVLVNCKNYEEQSHYLIELIAANALSNLCFQA